MATAPGEVRCAACILPLEGKQVRSLVLQYSPSRFGQTYRDDIARADNVVAYLGTNVVDLETPRPPTQATGAQIACLSGSRFRARARVFVLAGGGVENARLLLLANSVQPAGLGNTHDQVGRYFMEHLYVDRAATVLARAERIGSFYTDGHWSAAAVWPTTSRRAPTERRTAEARQGQHRGCPPAGHSWSGRRLTPPRGGRGGLYPSID